MEVDDHSGRFKRLFPTTISSPDRSPQARKGKKATGQKSSANSVVNTDSDHHKLPTLNTADDSPQLDCLACTKAKMSWYNETTCMLEVSSYLSKLWQVFC